MPGYQKHSAFIHRLLLVIGDCYRGSLVFVAPAAVCIAVSGTWDSRSNISKTHIEYRLDRYGKDAGIDEELKKLKYVEVFKKTGWSHDSVQKIVDILEENHRQD